ncbi:Peptidyl-prolyl cis-trans isomerase CYP95 [Bienertia sinuspersici]
MKCTTSPAIFDIMIQLIGGEKGVGPKLRKPLHYKGTFFHRIVNGFMAQGGDLLRQEGSAGESIYGDRFPDESPKLKHDEPGLLSMSVADRDIRGSIFNLVFKANQNLDRKEELGKKLAKEANLDRIVMKHDGRESIGNL